MRKRILMILLLACIVMLPACGTSVGVSKEASSGASQAPSAEASTLAPNETVTAESAAPTASAKATESAALTASVAPSESAKATESVAPSASAKATESATLSASAAPSASAKATESAAPSASAKAVESTAPSASAEATESTYDVELYVFLYDKCGGCGVDSPGCGNCQDIVNYHGIIKKQLGNRLYDGTILYRMLNCRLEANDHTYDAYSEAYGIPKAQYGTLPTIFLGTPEGGVYLVGEKMLDYVGEYLDKYLVSDDLASLQQEIDAKHLELYPDGIAAQ